MSELLRHSQTFVCIGKFSCITNSSGWEFCSIISSLENKYGQAILELACSWHWTDKKFFKKHITKKCFTENAFALKAVADIVSHDSHLVFEGYAMSWIKVFYSTLNLLISQCGTEILEKLTRIDNQFDNEISHINNLVKNKKSSEYNIHFEPEEYQFDYDQIKRKFTDINNYKISSKFANVADLKKMTSLFDYCVKVMTYLLKETSNHGMLVNLVINRSYDQEICNSLANQYKGAYDRFIISPEENVAIYHNHMTGLFSQARQLQARILYSQARALILYIYAAVEACPSSQPIFIYKETPTNPLEGLKTLYRLITQFWLQIYQVAAYGQLPNEFQQYKMEIDSLYHHNDPSIIITNQLKKNSMSYSTMSCLSLLAEKKIKLPICLQLDEDILRRFGQVGRYKPKNFCFDRNNDVIARKYSGKLNKNLDNGSSTGNESGHIPVQHASSGTIPQPIATYNTSSQNLHNSLELANNNSQLGDGSTFDGQPIYSTGHTLATQSTGGIGNNSRLDEYSRDCIENSDDDDDVWSLKVDLVVALFGQKKQFLEISVIFYSLKLFIYPQITPFLPSTGLIVPDSFAGPGRIWKNSYRGGYNGSWQHVISKRQKDLYLPLNNSQ